MNTGSIAYFIKSSFKGMFKNALMTLASLFVLVACMIIIGSAFLASENVLSFMDKLEGQNEIVAFISDDYGDDNISRDKLCERVEGIDGVESVEYITKEQAFAEYRDSFGEDDRTLYAYEGEDNPLGNELRIKINDINLFENIVATINTDFAEEIEYVRDSQEVVDMLISVRKVLTALGLWILAILAIVSLFIISNTIKLAMYSRRNEINIMKYVGATNGFIRFPFVLEGIIIGLVSTILALAVQWCIYTYAILPLLSNLTFLTDCTVPFGQMFSKLILMFGGIGLGVGIFGSVISIRKYLKV